MVDFCGCVDDSWSPFFNAIFRFLVVRQDFL
jgi:hypothetical protein